ncbi:MAG: hypothetical protein K8R53_11435 [Bacteroidales bacterium]|nr:hypothetical protein [Bacteroidales bacterium]
MKKLLSIWMIKYNHEDYISKAIERVLFQKTDFSFNVYVGEGSAIGTLSLVRGIVKP